MSQTYVHASSYGALDWLPLLRVLHSGLLEHGISELVPVCNVVSYYVWHA